MHKKLLLLISVGLAGVLLSALFLLSSDRIDAPPDFFSEPDSFYTYWEQKIQKHGTNEAYQQFTNAYSASKVELKHALGHAFAELLYAADGIGAMEVCDDDYSYSCFHELVASKVFEDGIEVLPDINDLCNEKVWCQHGIGHALIKLNGYDVTGLKEAIDGCESIPRYDTLDGCVGGMFMEFYRDHVNSEEEPSAEVCPLVQEWARESCYFWLGQWFLTNVPDEEVYARFSWAAQKCSEIEDLKYRLHCYKRLGYDSGNYSTDPDTARSYCEQSVPAGDEYFEVQCKAGGAAQFYTYEHMRSDAPKLCEGLSGDHHVYCMYAAQKLPYTHDRRIESYGEVTLP